MSISVMIAFFALGIVADRNSFSTAIRSRTRSINNIDNYDNEESRSYFPQIRSQLQSSHSISSIGTSSTSSTISRRRVLGNYYMDTLVDGMETSYDEYSQAWRMLGFYFDCSDSVDAAAAGANEAQRQRQRRRRYLEEQGQVDNDDGEDDAADGNNGDDAANAENADNAAADNNNQEENQSSCKRYLLWAAYVDLEYQGNGLNEYQIYNVQSKKWDSSMCNSNSSSSSDKARCVKMDCHLPNSHFKLLGFFKEEYPLEFLNVLSNHQGTCTWDDESRATFSSAIVSNDANNEDGSSSSTSGWIPASCTQSTTIYDPTNHPTSYLYYDIQPKSGGMFDIGLYTDSICTKPYHNSNDKTNTVSSVLQTIYNDKNLDVNGIIHKINGYLREFQVCQPCRTYDLSVSGNICVDTAGYEGVNMCGMFATTTQIQKASFHDVSMASAQTTIVRTYAETDVVETWWQQWGFLLLSLFIFITGLLFFCAVAVKVKRTGGNSSRSRASSSRVVFFTTDKRVPLLTQN